MRCPALVLVVSAISAAAAPSSVHAQRTGLEDLIGARAGQAEGEIERRGYRDVGGEKSDGRSYTYWWNDRRRQCVAIATVDGRYDSMVPTPSPDCRRGESSDDRYRRDRDDRPGRGYVAFDELSRVCRNEAAAEFDRRPSEVTANMPIKQRDGFLVQGWYDRRDASKGTKFFNCRFDVDGRFVGVN